MAKAIKKIKKVMSYQAIMRILKIGWLRNITLKNSHLSDEKSAIQRSWNENRS